MLLFHVCTTQYIIMELVHTSTLRSPTRRANIMHTRTQLLQVSGLIAALCPLIKYADSRRTSELFNWFRVENFVVHARSDIFSWQVCIPHGAAE